MLRSCSPQLWRDVLKHSTLAKAYSSELFFFRAQSRAFVIEMFPCIYARVYVPEPCRRGAVFKSADTISILDTQPSDTPVRLLPSDDAHRTALSPHLRKRFARSPGWLARLLLARLLSRPYLPTTGPQLLFLNTSPSAFARSPVPRTSSAFPRLSLHLLHNFTPSIWATTITFSLASPAHLRASPVVSPCP